MIEPNCDMPWEIYLDWLQDQSIEDLRDIDPGIISSSVSMTFYPNINNQGCGADQEGSTGISQSSFLYGSSDVYCIVADGVYSCSGSGQALHRLRGDGGFCEASFWGSA